MSSSRGIDWGAKDGGLRSALKMCDVPTDLIDKLTDPAAFNPIETMRDFLYFAKNKSSPEAEWEEFLNTFQGYSTRDRHGSRNQGRVLAALELCRDTKDQMQQTQTDRNGELDAPLGDSVEKDLKARFMSLYMAELKFIPDRLRPSPKTVAYMYRMFQWGQPQLIHVEKLVSLESTKMVIPKVEAKVENITIAMNSQRITEIKTVDDYYFALRLLSNANAWAGSHVVKDKDGKDVVYAPKAVNDFYADEAFGHATKVSHRPLDWLRSRDLKCRAKAVTLMIDGLSQGEALYQAYDGMIIQWQDYTRYNDVNSEMAETIRSLQRRLENFEKSASNVLSLRDAKRHKGDGKGNKGYGRDNTPPPPPPQHPAGRPDRKGGGRGDGNGGKGSPQQLSKYVNQLPGGAIRCRDFNSNQGCSSGGPGADCAKGAHRCSHRLTTNKACAELHSAVRCNNPKRLR